MNLHFLRGSCVFYLSLSLSSTNCCVNLRIFNDNNNNNNNDNDNNDNNKVTQLLTEIKALKRYIKADGFSQQRYLNEIMAPV